MLKKGSTATSPSDIAVDVRSVVKVFTQSQRENAGNGVLKGSQGLRKSACMRLIM